MDDAAWEICVIYFVWKISGRRKVLSSAWTLTKTTKMRGWISTEVVIFKSCGRKKISLGSWTLAKCAFHKGCWHSVSGVHVGVLVEVGAMGGGMRIRRRRSVIAPSKSRSRTVKLGVFQRASACREEKLPLRMWSVFFCSPSSLPAGQKKWRSEVRWKRGREELNSLSLQHIPVLRTYLILLQICMEYIFPAWLCAYIRDSREGGMLLAVGWIIQVFVSNAPVFLPGL